MSKPRAPKAPDPYQTAGADYAYNNPSQYTPWGSVVNTPPTFGGSGDNRYQTGAGRMDYNLSPELQDILNKQLSVSGITLDEALRRQGELSNLGALPSPDRGKYEQELFQRQRGLLDPVFSEQQRGLSDRLSNQGLPTTSEAYGYDQGQFMDQRNRSYERAAMESTLGAGDYMSQDINNAAQLRSIPFNEIASLLGIQQVQPQPLSSFYAPRGTDFTGAQALNSQVQGQNYQQQSGMFNNMLSGLFKLGAAGIAASDRRLKKNISLIGKTPNGHNWYSFEYLWGEKAEGVMADEVINTGAVLTGPNGYLFVDYGRIG